VYLHNVGHDVRLCASNDRVTILATKNRGEWERWQVEAGTTDRFYFRSHFSTLLNQGSDGRTIQSPNRGQSELYVTSHFLSRYQSIIFMCVLK
jgi:hypothetical protein